MYGPLTLLKSDEITAFLGTLVPYILLQISRLVCAPCGQSRSFCLPRLFKVFVAASGQRTGLQWQFISRTTSFTE